MRLSISFRTAAIPVPYRMMVLSIIKEALKRADPSYYYDFYERNLNQMKPFTMAVHFHDFQFQEDVIRLDAFNLLVSSPDQEFVLHLYNGMLQQTQYSYRDFQMQRGAIRPLPEKTIRSDRVLFRTVSPILIEDASGKPLAPDDENYEKEINYFADLILKNYRGAGLQKPLQSRARAMEKQVIKESHQDSFTSGKWTYFTAYKGLLGLAGHPDDLQLLYQLGLSKRRSQGFGMLEIEREGG